MEAVTNTPISNCHILNNSPALHSLKRQQLVQLCKRNGIKATGKNSEIVEKLKAYASTHPLEPSSLGGQPLFSDGDDGDKENRRTGPSRRSETWSVIEDDSREVQRVHSELKEIREDVEQEMSNMSPLKEFGISSSGEFGNGTTSSKGSSISSSIRAFASSLKRGGSKTGAQHDVRMKQSFNALRQNQESKMITEPTPTIIPPIHTEEPPVFDTPITTTPCQAHPQTYPPSPLPQLLNVDNSQDQAMLDFGASTIRLVTTAPTAPSPPMLRPFTPTFEPPYSPGSPSVPTLYPSLPVDQDSNPLPPGGFPGAFSTPSGLPKASCPVPPPFVFGSPVHRISNTEFNSAATSVLAEMNTRLGLTGTSNEVSIDLLEKRHIANGAPLPEPQDRPRTNITSMFDKAHERQFQKMEGLGEWYTRRNAGSLGKSAPQDMSTNRKRKSDVLGRPHRRPIGPSNARARRSSRVVTPRTRRSLAAEAEVMDGRKMKRVRINVVDGGDKKVGASTDNKSLDESEGEDEKTVQTNEERERERAAIKKKLEISRARRRSSMGRVSVGGGRPPLIPNQTKKGMTAKFGFLSSAKNIVKSVWKGVGGSAPKQNSALPVTGPSHRTVPAATKKSTPNVLTKPVPAAKPSVPKPTVAKPSTPKPEPNPRLRIPAMGIGLGRKTSTRTSTNSTPGTRSSTASSGTHSITPSSAFGIAAARRGAIPSFQQPLSRMSRTNSLASVKGVLGSKTSSNGTGSSRGSSAANSIGLKKSGIPSGVRPSDVGNSSTNSIVRKRTSTLFAPTVSSLAKMQSTVRPRLLSNAALRPNAIGAESKALAKVPEQRSSAQSGPPSFAFTSPPPVGGLTTDKGISSNGTPTFSPSQVPVSQTDVPKPRIAPARRPRISRSRVIARVGAQRAASGSSLTRTPSGRRSFNVPKTRGNLGMRVSGIGAKSSARDSAVVSARKRLRQSEILRRRSKLSEMSPSHLQRDDTPDDGNVDSTEGDKSHEDPGASSDVSMEG